MGGRRPRTLRSGAGRETRHPLVGYVFDVERIALDADAWERGIATTASCSMSLDADAWARVIMK
jgi:hypothetical protein